ncbi:hypothetical protein IscW_ISCW022312 [Ixodes scapularis]|uniref:Uncharacterized protein n=1 Tax=Ixodes scapularis TaxID=6945 RepID=B7QBH6_IXOSC|nr:hypothetical protein IscW_ISCW022312 [Ixodes scapularis]|eukprot:XP_002412902.1 hypothetical protein IscW_ISCW022312 [Ixodes scapularis]
MHLMTCKFGDGRPRDAAILPAALPTASLVLEALAPERAGAGCPARGRNGRAVSGGVLARRVFLVSVVRAAAILRRRQGRGTGAAVVACIRFAILGTAFGCGPIT